MRRPSRAAGGGFTLVEVLLVMAILATIMTLMWSSFSQAARSKKRVEAAQERIHTVRVALFRMVRELEMAYRSDSNPITSTEQRTRFVGVTRPDVDELTFSAFAHQRLRGGAAESDTAIISYYGERDPEDRRVLNLMRRETRRLQALAPEAVPGESYVLCPDIARVKFSYYDIRKKEWRDEWDTRVPATPFLPVHVRIVLTVLDEYGKEVDYSTDARIHLTELVSYR